VGEEEGRDEEAVGGAEFREVKEVCRGVSARRAEIGL